MEQIMIDRIKNGYTIYQKGMGTVFYDSTEEIIEAVKLLIVCD